MTIIDSHTDSAPVPVDSELLEALTATVRARLAEAGAGDTDGRTTPDQRHEAITATVAAVVQDHAVQRLRSAGTPVTAAEAAALRDMLHATVTGTAGLAPLLADTNVEDIWANGHDNVWVHYADGTTRPGPPVAGSDPELIELVRTLASHSSAEQERRFDRASPIVDVRLPDGARLHAAMAVTTRPCISIRRHRHLSASLSDLEHAGVFGADLHALLAASIQARFNIIVAGRTGAGKTTVLRALASAIDSHERILTIEDSFELGLDTDPRHPNVVAMQARQPNIEGEGGISQRALFRAGLRMNPGRVIVGEVRGDEAIDMLHAMSQGNDGSLSTIHASSSAGVVDKLVLFGSSSPERLAPAAMARLIAGAVDLIIHMGVDANGRRVITSVREVVGCDTTQVVTNELYRPGPDGAATAAAPLTQARTQRLHACQWPPPSTTVAHT